MLFILFSLIFIIVSILAFRRFAVVDPFSKGILLAILLSIVAAISLAQNYNESLIPEANDGIGISNRIAYWIIGEEGWSIERFQKIFENSITLTLLLTIIYPVVLVIEKKISKGASNGHLLES